MAGSFPAAATFWTVYTAAKRALIPVVPESTAFLAHALAASTAELAVCSVRTPFEVVKQQMQAGLHASTGACFCACVRACVFLCAILRWCSIWLAGVNWRRLA